MTARGESPAREAPPHDSEAEQATLGALLLDSHAVRVVKDILKASDFYELKHQRIYEAILALRDRGVEADLVTLSDELRRIGTLEPCGGGAYVSRLTSVMPTSANVSFYAGIVHNLAKKRQLDALAADWLEGKLELPAYIDQVAALRNGRGRAREIRVLSVADVLQYPPVEYVIEPYAPAGAVVLLTAFTGTGKSVLASAMAIAAMSGLPFLGRFGVQRPGPVLYFDEESPRSYLKDRLLKMGFRADDPFHLVHFEGLKLENDADFEAIRGLVEKYSPSLVVFDTLIRFHSADENDATEMAFVMGRVRTLANMGPCVLVQIHHGKQGELRTRSRGSSDIVDAADLELALTVKDEEHGLLTLQSVKARMAPIASITLRIQETDGALEIAEAEDWTAEQVDTLTEILAESTESLSASKLHKEMESRGVKCSLNTVRNRLAAMELPYELGPRGVKLYHLAEGDR
jgi:hypothetical protein